MTSDQITSTSGEAGSAAAPASNPTAEKYAKLRERLLDAIVPNVIFDGWSDAALKQAAKDCDIDLGLVRVICPRGALDLAVAYHRRGDAEMLRRLAGEDLASLRFRDRVARALRLRLEVVDREVVRRAMSLFALPQHSGEAAKLMWGTVDAIWKALGDGSEDINWYTKRATLSGVYSSTVLYWLGDESEGSAETWAFLDRRIDNVMQIEKLKARVNENKLLSSVLAGPIWLAGRVRAPGRMPDDLPGRQS